MCSNALKSSVCCLFGTNKFVSCLFTSHLMLSDNDDDDCYVDLGRNWSWIVDLFGYRWSLYPRVVRLLSSLIDNQQLARYLSALCLLFHFRMWKHALTNVQLSQLG